MARGRKRTNTYYEMALFGTKNSPLLAKKNKRPSL